MKSSWVMGIVMMYLLILALEMMVTGGSVFASIPSSNQSIFMQPDISSSGGVIADLWTIITNVGRYLKVFAEILVLWAPTVFSGYLLWIWWFICFPIDCMMVFAIVTIARGVHSA